MRTVTEANIKAAAQLMVERDGFGDEKQTIKSAILTTERAIEIAKGYGDENGISVNQRILNRLNEIGKDGGGA